MNPLDLLPLVAIAAAFWLLLIRPAQRRRREQEALVASLAVGQRIMTTAGLFGTLSAIRDELVVVEVAPGVELEMLAVAIARVMPVAEDAGFDPADGSSLELDGGPDDSRETPRGEADRG
ncbi:MAG: preprotein translocase subunit YajC [Candidatus Nanopelagicales bacterium]